MDYNSLGTKLEFLRARMQNTDELVSTIVETMQSIDHCVSHSICIEFNISMLSKPSSDCIPTLQ